MAEADSVPPPTPARASLAHDWLLAATGAGAALLLAWAAENLLALQDLSPIFLLAVLLVATRARSGAAIATALLCFLGWNWFFTDPRHTLTVWARRDLVNLALFLVVALISSRLAGQLRAQVLELRQTNAGIQSLQKLGRELLQASDEAAVLAVAERAFGMATGTGLAADARMQAILHRADLEPGRRLLLQAMAQDVAEALARCRLQAALEAARRQSETDQLRNALLSSVSHDLRSPLSAIVGAAESLGAYGESMPAEDRRSLQESILSEGQRLDRYIQNLLDMARLGHGELRIQRDWVAPAELIGAAARRLRRQFPEIVLQLEVPSELPLLWVHPALVEQAMFNILENAARFSPPGAPVSLRARVDGDRLRIEVADRGPGIPEDERARIFDMFYSVARGDRGEGGTGLGLSICQGLVGAHGGSVEALPGAGGIGTLIVVTLPLTAPPDAPA